MLHRLAWFLPFLGVLALSGFIGCGSARPHVDGPGLSGWESQMLGAKPDAYFVVRMDKALADPVYGGPRTPFDPPPKSPPDPEVEAFMRTITSIEGWVMFDTFDREDHASVLAVVRGRPSLDVLKKLDKDKKIRWREPERLPSGALLYDLSDEKTPSLLVVLPSGTWVGATGPITGRLRYHFHGSSADPPSSSYEPDALFAVWVGPGLTRAVSKDAKAKGQDGGDSLGLQGGSIVIRSSAKGDMEMTASFVDDKHAERVTAMISAFSALLPTFRRELANQCPAWDKVDFEVKRDAKTITGRISNLPPVIRAYRTGACRYEDAHRAVR